MKRITGIVERGRREGTRLGYPTANIACPNESLAGVYAARVSLRGKEYPAAVFVDAKRRVLEAHLLDFTDDFYDETISVELIEKMRESRKFESEEELIRAIGEDIARVRRIMENPK